MNTKHLIAFLIFNVSFLITPTAIAQPYTTNRTGTAPSGTTLILADIINSNEQITGSNNMSYSGTQSIHLTDGFSASGFTGTGLFHAYLQPLQIAYISAPAASVIPSTIPETETPYASAGVSAIPQYSRFEIGIQLPTDVQTQITNFLVDAYSTIQPNDINPYDPNQVQIEVDFTNGTNTYTRYGFYYTDFTQFSTGATFPNSHVPWTKNTIQYPFRARFAPPSTGAWNFTVKLYLGGTAPTNIVASFTGSTFNVIASSDKGFLSIDPTTQKLKFAETDNTLFFGIGEDIAFASPQNEVVAMGAPFNDYAFDIADPNAYNQQRGAIADLINNKGNFVRIRLDPWSNAVETNEMQVYANDPIPKPLINCVTNYDHNQRHMWEFDQTLALCEQDDLYVILNLLDDGYFGIGDVYIDPPYAGEYNPQLFTFNPYNALEGSHPAEPTTGMQSTLTDSRIYNFFIDPAAINAYKKTLFYIVARWGYSPHIAMWEHINETNNLGTYIITDLSGYSSYYNDDANFASAVRSWINTMTTHIKTLDPNHLQTTGYGFLQSTDITDAANITCLDVYSGNDYSGSIKANVDKYANHHNPNPNPSWGSNVPSTGTAGTGYVTSSLMYTKPFLLGENGVGCNGTNTTGVGVDPDAPDNNSDIDFHKNLWSSAFSGSISTALHWTDWFQTVSNPSPPPAANHRALNFPILSNFLAYLNTNFNFNQQVLYPQNEYPTGAQGSNYGGTTIDYQSTSSNTLYKFVDNFFLLNAPSHATQAYGYCYNRSYFWQTDPAIYKQASPYKCSKNDSYSVRPDDAYGIDVTINATDPPLHFYNLQPNTVFNLAYFETTNGSYVGTISSTSGPLNGLPIGELDFNLTFGAGSYTVAPSNYPDATHNYPDYAYVLSAECHGCGRTANNTTGSPPVLEPSPIIVQTKLGSNIKLGIYPNPTSGTVYLNLSTQSAGALLVNITDVNGNQLLHNRFAANEGANSFKLDLSNLNSGVYFINITDENGVSIKNDKLVLMGQ